MRKQFIILVLISSLFYLSGCNTNHTSNLLTSTPQTQIKSSLSYINMSDQNNGWALSDASVLKSTDGGTDWVKVTPSGFPTTVNEFHGFFLNEKIGWVGVSSPDSIDVYRTTNGGTNWDKYTMKMGASNINLFFSDDRHGWLLDFLGAAAGYDPVSIFKTDDGGTTWKSASDINTNGPKNGIYFKDSMNGWITGQQPSGKNIYYITKDGGLSWNISGFRPDQAGNNFFSTTYPPIFSDFNQGFLPVNYSVNQTNSTILYRTLDGGKTWVGTTPVNINAFYFSIISDICWVSDGNTLYKSDDAGKTWLMLNNKIASEDITQLDFINNKIGWAIGLNSLYKTIDGGEHWSEIGIKVK